MSEDLDGILEPSDRIVVMHDGRVVHETGAAGPPRRQPARICWRPTDGCRACPPRSTSRSTGDQGGIVGWTAITTQLAAALG